MRRPLQYKPYGCFIPPCHSQFSSKFLSTLYSYCQSSEANTEYVFFFTSEIGTEADLFAGYRSCQCLEGFYRTDMFKECKKCGHGLQCKDDYASLKSGYWWKWRNENHKRRYKEFIKNLLKPIPALGKNDVQYPYPIPIQYKCRMESSCKGGLDSECENGYEGPLCDVCSLNHYKQFQACKRCPSRNWMVG